ncbi:fungal fucose-specific lectin [Aspergillus taichungensis]|uniref:Fucose-specific lectin n=1 Tax=Aspergillus taichungensis TaxID=482145 RepID=A0A2J5HV42_9EURO|nr:fungal fucose-specific lectin [Aspergillus taichungensis]
MSSIGAQQIRFRCGIAPIGNADSMRIYVQDTNGGIREVAYDSGHWSRGTEKDIIGYGVLGSPIAAICRGFKHIRVFYMGAENMLREACCDAGGSWYDGDLSKKKVQVAPYSMLSACFLAGTEKLQMRVYFQAMDNTIKEFDYDDNGKGWQEMTSQGRALPGTGMACTSFHDSKLRIRLYMQDERNNIFERCYDDGQGWSKGQFSVRDTVPRTDLSVTSFNRTSIRVYYVDRDNKLKEMGYDGKDWYQGGFNRPCVPGSQNGAVSFMKSDNVRIHVFFQRGELVTAVTEWIYEGSWKEGKAALPPA